MTAHPAVNTALIAARRLELNLSLREVADALGLAEAGWRHLEQGNNLDCLTLGQLGVLADLLCVPIEDLLVGEQPVAPPAASALEQRVGAALLLAGRSLSLGLLAEAMGATTDDVRAALDALQARLAPAGLVVSRKGVHATLVPDRGSLQDDGIRAAMRAGDARDGLPSAPARLLHRLASGESMAQAPSREDQARAATLLRGGWVVAGEEARSGHAAVALHPDVRFSLALDDGVTYARAEATLLQAPRGRRHLPWLDDTTEVPAGDPADGASPFTGTASSEDS